MYFIILTSLIHLLQPMDTLKTPFEKGNGNQTSTYEECINYYQTLTTYSALCKLETHGSSSVGKPIHLFIIDADKQFTRASATLNNKLVLFINNGIHPGEPDGIDASMMFARDVMFKKEYSKLLERCVIVIIPTYNISGMLNRNQTSRVNQHGPEAYGFRANRQNLDLNRDFIKCDSKEAITFNKIFSAWRPELFIDTHVSNGADYSYVMTYIATHPDKLPYILADYEQQILIPDLHSAMKSAGFEMIPYVNTKEESPKNGIISFLETGRYSTGYAALHNCIGFMPETHMLKPYADRVSATYAFILHTLIIGVRDAEKIISNKRKADQQIINQEQFAVRWKLDETRIQQLPFKGYEETYDSSEVTNMQQLHYHAEMPYEENIPFYANYVIETNKSKPLAYIIPQCFDRVIECLIANSIQMDTLNEDITLELPAVPIQSYNTLNKPAEGHYMHYDIKTGTPVNLSIPLYKGDVIVQCNQQQNRYLIETLEPESHDSFFAWNFFDAFLQRKEYFSDYVFEPLCKEILANEPGLRQAFEEKKKTDESFANDAHKQLQFIYENSKYAEKMYKIYPVFRVEDDELLRALLK